MPLGLRLERAHKALGLVDQRAARGAREALEGAQGERRLAALDLDRPRSRDEAVDQVARADLQVAPLVDRVAVGVRQGSQGGPSGVFTPVFAVAIRDAYALVFDVFRLAQDVCGEGGDTTISFSHRTQRAPVPTISQARSPDTMSRRHFGHVYPLTAGAKSYCGPT